MYSGVPIPCVTVRWVPSAARDAEIDEGQTVSGIDEGVGGLDVAVGDALAVGVVQRLGKLAHEVEDTRQRQRLILAGDVVERATFEQLHNEVMEVVMLSDVEDLDDVWMAQAGGQSDFAIEQVDEAVAGREAGRHDLDRALHAERPMDATVHRGHASTTEQLLDGVRADSPPYPDVDYHVPAPKAT